jgi:hypothetical protein
LLDPGLDVHVECTATHTRGVWKSGKTAETHIQIQHTATCLLASHHLFGAWSSSFERNRKVCVLRFMETVPRPFSLKNSLSTVPFGAPIFVPLQMVPGTCRSAWCGQKRTGSRSLPPHDTGRSRRARQDRERGKSYGEVLGHKAGKGRAGGSTERFV